MSSHLSCLAWHVARRNDQMCRLSCFGRQFFLTCFCLFIPSESFSWIYARLCATPVEVQGLAFVSLSPLLCEFDSSCPLSHERSGLWFLFFRFCEFFGLVTEFSVSIARQQCRTSVRYVVPALLSESERVQFAVLLQ